MSSMQDAFNQKLEDILKILKSSPGSITVQNIQRLSNIYKFETFIEAIDDNVKRLSIAGKILVIDIDFTELENNTKNQTRFNLVEVKLILANNNNSFKYSNSDTGQNILKESLTTNENLMQFDKNLEVLSLFDQYTKDQFDLFDYHLKIYESFIQLGHDVVLNYNDGFVLLVDRRFQISLVYDDRTVLQNKHYEASQWVDKDSKIDDIGIKVEILNDGIPATKSLLTQSGMIIDEYTSYEMFESEDFYESLKRRDLKIQVFQLFDAQLIKISSFIANDLQVLSSVVKTLQKFDILSRFVTGFKSKLTRKDKFSSVGKDDLKLKDFLDDVENEMDVDDGFVTLTLKSTAIESKSGDAGKLEKVISFEDTLFENKVIELEQMYESELYTTVAS